MLATRMNEGLGPMERLIAASLSLIRAQGFANCAVDLPEARQGPCPHRREQPTAQPPGLTRAHSKHLLTACEVQAP